MLIRIAVIIALLFGTSNAIGQLRLDATSLYNGSYLLDYHINPVSNMWVNFLIEDNNGIPKRENKRIIDSLKKILSNQKAQYLILEAPPESKVIFVEHKGTHHFYKVIKEHEDFFLLCSTPRDLCDCKAYMKIYVPQQDILKNVERAFSFSILRNLKYHLDDFGLDGYIDTGEDNLCDFLTKL